MRQYNTLYYLLFVLLIMGAFASMAQNEYGVAILGLVAVSFSALFLIQFISVFTKRERDWSHAVELTSLAVLSGIMALRVFYIHFSFVEILFGIAATLLILVYVRKMVQAYSSINLKSKRLAWLIVAFYCSIVLYTFSMVTVPFFPSVSEPTGGMAFGVLILFVAGAITSREILFEGEKVSTFQFVSRFKGPSVLLMTLFLLFTLYLGFTKITWLPRMYSNEFPQSYFELVQRAETGKEKPVSGKYKHEEFKQQYDRFVKRQLQAVK